MCLAVPGLVLSLTCANSGDPFGRVGRVDFGGVVREVNLAFTPQAEVGDHVLVHVGFAISVIDAVQAARIFEQLAELGEMDSADGVAP